MEFLDSCFQGKTILVTGGARGIGWAVLELAASVGAQVVVCDIDPAAARAAAMRLGTGVLGIGGDVSSEDDCERVIATALDRFGKLDVLVNNAGVAQPLIGTLKQDLATWRHVLDVNLQGTFLMSKAAVAVMRDREISGAIVNICSIAGLIGFRASNAYGVSKAAVAMLTQTLATDLAASGIRVNAVAPGFVGTQMVSDILDEERFPEQALQRRIPMGRLGSPDEIAAAVLFLASPLASYITGAVLPVDGGWCAFGGPGDASKDVR